MRKCTIGAALIAMFAASMAFADIKVRAYTSAGAAIPTLSQDGIASGAAITIILNSTTGRIFVFEAIRLFQT
jgi:hypothetical protein